MEFEILLSSVFSKCHVRCPLKCHMILHSYYIKMLFHISYQMHFRCNFKKSFEIFFLLLFQNVTLNIISNVTWYVNLNFTTKCLLICHSKYHLMSLEISFIIPYAIPLEYHLKCHLCKFKSPKPVHSNYLRFEISQLGEDPNDDDDRQQTNHDKTDSFRHIYLINMSHFAYACKTEGEKTKSAAQFQHVW